MTDDAQVLLAEALEIALRAAIERQPDPLDWLLQVDTAVLPDLFAGLESRLHPDGRAIADPANAALIAKVLAQVVARLRREFGA